MKELEAEKVFRFLSLALVLFVSLSLVYDGLASSSYFLPTYDNSMLHAGRARVILDSGRWAEMELVFGGITKSYHLPLYPALAAGLSSLTGLNLWWAIRLLGLIITGLLLPLAFYALAKRISSSWQAGVASALLVLNLPSLMTWGSRTSPISLGVVLVVLALYFVAKKDFALAALAGISLAFTHQPSLLAFGLALAIYFLALAVERVRHYKQIKPMRLFDELKPVFFIGISTLAVYLVWHLRQTGFSCLNFKCLPHLAAREYGAAVDLINFLQLLPRELAVGGVAVAAVSRRIHLEHKLLLFSWLAAMLLLVKNDALGIGVFTERFLTFFDEALAVFAGVFVGWVYAKAQEHFGKS